MIEKFLAMYNALKEVNEIDGEISINNKFASLKAYLIDSSKDSITLSFEKIEELIGAKLCKSARTYSAYWSPSETHTMPNTINDAGYDIVSVDLGGECIYLQKKG